MRVLKLIETRSKKLALLRNIASAMSYQWYETRPLGGADHGAAKQWYCFTADQDVCKVNERNGGCTEIQSRARKI